jgi:hypothetical protein
LVPEFGPEILLDRSEATSSLSVLYVDAYDRSKWIPAEFETVEGQVRWRILRAMFQAAASQAHWIGTLSNWTLGTTGIYIGLVVTNFDTVSRHHTAESQMQIFWFALFSAVVGIAVQVLWGTVQFQLNVEERVFAVLPSELAKPGADSVLVHRIIDPVISEFINSRPFLFRQLARFGKEKGAKDLVLVPKSAATIAQVMSLLRFLQYISLGAAIFWPLGVITLTPNRPAIGSLSTTPMPTPTLTPTSSQTPTPVTSEPTLSPKPNPTASATPISK